jgi:hypothetical protein
MPATGKAFVAIEIAAGCPIKIRAATCFASSPDDRANEYAKLGEAVT